jgi:hypothetical protein
MDLEALKAKFLSRSGECHPDRAHNAAPAERELLTARFAALNSAYQTLREPKERLAHLLELELGKKPTGIEGVPPDLMDWFMAVGTLCRKVDAFLTDHVKVTSPLLKVQRFQEGMTWGDEVNKMIVQLSPSLDSAIAGLEKWNQAWASAPEAGRTERMASLPLADLEWDFRKISFLSRWLAQLRERVVRLAV